MATSIKRSPLIAPRAGKAYRLEMEGRTILLLVSLLGLTGVVVFSLGVVTGMGMRVPEGAVSVATVSAPPADEKEAVPPAESLAFNQGVQAPEKSIEGLKADEGRITDQTKALLERGRELKLEELPVKRPVQQAASNAPAEPPARPAVRSPAPPQGAQFTVQVFSSRHRKNARQLMLRLKRQGFDAYMNQFQGAGRQTWYRVRVGRVNRADAQRLVDQLKAEARLKAPRIIQL